MKRNFLFVVLLTAAACSSDNERDLLGSLPGRYKITSIQSVEYVDLNNDGIKSNDIFFEISAPHHCLNGQVLSFYDFNDFGSYMEVRPLPDASNDAQLISINIPD